MALLQGQTNLLGLLGLFLVAVLVRVPCFTADYCTTDESLYLAIGERLADGHTLYTEAWDNKPPILYWFYGAFSSVFGNLALAAIRVFTVLYLFAGGLLFNQVLSAYRFLPAGVGFLPGLLFVCAHATPWYTLELNAEHLMTFPLLGGFLYALRFATHENPRTVWLFWLGLLGAVCIGIKFQGVFPVAALALGTVVTGRVRLPELLALLGGLLVGIGALLGVLYQQGALAAFYDLVIRFGLDYIALPGNPGETAGLRNLLEYAKVWGVLLVWALLGFLALRARAGSIAIRQRKFETFMGLWFIGGMLSVGLGGRFYLHYLVLALVPILFYALWYIYTVVPRRFRQWALLAAWAFPLFTASTYLLVATPGNYVAAREWLPVSPDGWLSGIYQQLHITATERALQAELQQRNIRGVWVARYQPELYVRLQQPCSSKYVAYNLAHVKMLWLDHNVRLRGRLVSDMETMADAYRTFRAEMPPAVIDPDGVFNEIRRRLPLLLSVYEPHAVGSVTLWTLPPTATPSVSAVSAR